MAFSRMNRLVDCFSRVTRVRLLRYSNSSSTMSDEERTELEAKQQIENYSDEEKKKLESLEIDYWMRKRKCDWRFPQQMNSCDWVKMMQQEGLGKRFRLFRRLAQKERKLKKKEKKAAKKAAELKMAEEINSRIQKVEKTVLKRDTFFQALPNQYHSRFREGQDLKHVMGCHSLLFGSPLVFDFAMKNRTYKDDRIFFFKLCESQIANLNHPEPFHLHVTGLGPAGLEMVQKRLGPNTYIDYHTEEISDIFPVERLVYLTPYSKTPLQYNNEDIYVLPAFGFINSNKDAPELLKVKQLGARSACLPTSHHIRRKMMHAEKLFPIENIVKALLEFNFTRDWDKALRHVLEGLDIKDLLIYEKLKRNPEKKDD